MKIMNVDDDPMVRNLVRTILEASSHEVISAADGPEALKLIGTAESVPAVEFDTQPRQ